MMKTNPTPGAWWHTHIHKTTMNTVFCGLQEHLIFFLFNVMRIWFYFQSLAASCVFSFIYLFFTKHTKQCHPTLHKLNCWNKSQHLHPVPNYHHYWYRTFSEQRVIEFGGFMASSALSIDAVQNHYSDFLEMDHLWTWPRDKCKNGFKAFKEILPSLFRSFFPEWSWLSPTVWAASFVVRWWNKAAEAGEFHCHFNLTYTAEMTRNAEAFPFRQPRALTSTSRNRKSNTGCEWDPLRRWKYTG